MENEPQAQQPPPEQNVRKSAFVLINFAAIASCANQGPDKVKGLVSITASTDVVQDIEYPAVMEVYLSEVGYGSSISSLNNTRIIVLCEPPDSDWLVQTTIDQGENLGRCHDNDGGLYVIAEIQPLTLNDDEVCEEVNPWEAALDARSIARGKTRAWTDKDGCGEWYDEIEVDLTLW